MKKKDDKPVTKKELHDLPKTDQNRAIILAKIISLARFFVYLLVDIFVVFSMWLIISFMTDLGIWAGLVGIIYLFFRTLDYQKRYMEVSNKWSRSDQAKDMK